MRPLTFREMERVAGGYWHSYSYSSSGGGTAYGQEWIDDTPPAPSDDSNVSAAIPESVDHAFDYAPTSASDGLTIDTAASYLSVAGGLLDTLQTVYDATPQVDYYDNPAYESQGNVFDVFGQGGFGSFNDWFEHGGLLQAAPHDSLTLSSLSAGASNSGAFTTADVNNLGNPSGGIFTTEINGTHVTFTRHGDTAPTTSAGDDVQVNGQYWTVNFSDPLSTPISSQLTSISYNPLLDTNVGQRHQAYLNMDSSIQQGGHYKTDFFKAAANVTGLGMLEGAEIASEITNRLLGSYGGPFSLGSVDALETIGDHLYQQINLPAFEALYKGNDSYVMHIMNSDGSFRAVTLGSIAARGESYINVAMVENEQYNVQLNLNQLSQSVRSNLVAESNVALANFPDASVIWEQNRLGTSVDFGSVRQRIDIGLHDVATVMTSRGE